MFLAAVFMQILKNPQIFRPVCLQPASACLFVCFLTRRQPWGVLRAMYPPYLSQGRKKSIYKSTIVERLGPGKKHKVQRQSGPKRFTDLGLHTPPTHPQQTFGPLPRHLGGKFLVCYLVLTQIFWKCKKIGSPPPDEVPSPSPSLQSQKV